MRLIRRRFAPQIPWCALPTIESVPESELKFDMGVSLNEKSCCFVDCLANSGNVQPEGHVYTVRVQYLQRAAALWLADRRTHQSSLKDFEKLLA